MRKPGLTALGALCAALVAAPAAAKGMKVADLGPMASRGVCLTLAHTVLQDYVNQFGGLSVAGDTVDTDNWAIYGWGLRPDVTDVVITCPVVAGQTNAFLAIHADGPEGVANASLVAERIVELWGQPR